MRRFLAGMFWLLFKIPFFKKRFYWFHKRIFHRYRLFRGVWADMRLRGGIRMQIDLDDWIPQHLFFLGGYEQEELKLMDSILSNGSVFIDVGANIGLFSLHAARKAGEKGRVVSFEPLSKNFDALKRNISLNAFKNIIPEKLAISNMTEPIQISYDDKEGNSGMASSYLKDYTGSETVYSVTLDSYLKNHGVERVDFIKLDIEGGEYPALEGMEETIKRYRPAILIEINEEILSATPYSKKDILDFLTAQGYQQSEWSGAEGNYLFVSHNK